MRRSRSLYLKLVRLEPQIGFCETPHKCVQVDPTVAVEIAGSSALLNHSRFHSVADASTPVDIRILRSPARSVFGALVGRSASP
jgi:hypothetical protein